MSKPHHNRSIVIALVFFIPSSLLSEVCSDVFPGSISTSGDSSISLSGNTTIDDNSGGELITSNLNITGGPSCLDGTSQSCTETGSNSTPITLPTNNSTTDLTSAQNFTAGDYFYRSASLGPHDNITFSGSGTARLYFNSNVSIGNLSTINAGGSPSSMVIFIDGDLTISGNSTYNAIFYVTGTIDITGGATITGSLVAEGDITIGGNVTISYDSSYIGDADMGDNCTNDDPIHHYELSYNTSALTCLDQTITIKACMDTTCSTVAPTDTLVSLAATGTLSTWSSNPVTIPANSSSGVSVTLTHRAAETIILSSSSTPSATNPTVCSTADCSLIFSETGFILGLNNHQSCTTQNLTIQAVKLSETGTTCAPAYTGDQSVGFNFSYNNPNSGAGVTPVLDNTNLVVAPLVETRTVNFNAQATATLPFEYNDAGKLDITVSDTANAGLTSAMISTVVSPAKLIVSTTDTNNECSTNYGDCSKFKVAGIIGNTDSEFDLTIAGACSDNYITPNFQLSAIPLSLNLVAPSAAVGGHNGSLGTNSVDITNDGKATIKQTISEVGAFSITASPVANSYIDGESIPSATSTTIGRFIPDRFIVTDNIPLFTDATCNLTYQDQPFSFDIAAMLYPIITITAVNSDGATTLNYGGQDQVVDNNFWKLDESLLASRTYVNQVAAFPGILSQSLGGITTAGQNDYDGVSTFSFEDDQLTYEKSGVIPVATDDAPFDASVKLNLTAASLTDTDGVFFDSDNDGIKDLTIDAFAGTDITGTNIRWGRWFMENVFGSELQPLIMTAQAQYFDGNNFILNTDDNSELLCSTATSTITVLSDYSGNLSLGETTLPSTQTVITSGQIGLPLSAPGNGNDGSLLNTLTTPDWMMYDYNGDGTADDASATATFGIFEGREPVIFWRQTY